MQEVNEGLRILGTMPLWALVATIVITAFALAAYAIYAVSAIAKERK